MRSFFSLRAAGVAVVLSCAGLAHAENADVASDQKAGAQQTFEAGGKLYDGKRFQEALTAFRASYQIVASPNSRLMIARCLRELGKGAEAYREYEAVAAEARSRGGRYESTAKAADEERADLKAKIALVTISVAEPKEGATFKLNDAPLDPALLGKVTAMDPGTYVVTGEAPDGATARAEAAAGPGSQVTLEVRFEAKAEEAPPPPPPPVKKEVSTSGLPLRTMAYIAGGVGVVGLGAFAAFGLMSQSKYDDLKDKCANGCPPGSQDDIDSGKQQQTFANIGLIVGAVGVAAGATLFVLSLSKPNKEQPGPDVSLQIGPGSLGVRGSL